MMGASHAQISIKTMPFLTKIFPLLQTYKSKVATKLTPYPSLIPTHTMLFYQYIDRGHSKTNIYIIIILIIHINILKIEHHHDYNHDHDHASKIRHDGLICPCPSCTPLGPPGTSSGQCSSYRWCTCSGPNGGDATGTHRDPGTPSGPTTSSPETHNTWPAPRPHTHQCGTLGTRPQKAPSTSRSSRARPSLPNRPRSTSSSRASWAG